jgi:hypothetical protein
MSDLALPCDANGNFLPPGTPPPPRTMAPPDDWTPFNSEVQFRLADLLYRRAELSATNTNHLLEIWADSESSSAPFRSHREILSLIDSCKYGDIEWQCQKISIPVPVDERAPEWMRTTYEVWYRDPDVVITTMLENADFDGQFDLRPYIELDANGSRRWGNVMSGNIAWRHSVSEVFTLLITITDHS